MDWRPNFKDKSVFVTGHTGFKGSWLSIWLADLGAKVSGYSLPAPTEPSNFHLSGVESMLEHHTIGDVRDREGLAAALIAADPDVVIHMAAQPIVRASYREPVENFDINVMGTVHLLEAVRQRGKPCTVIVVTTDKCYANNEHGWCFREVDPMGGHDPYSASKGAAELVVASYRDSFFSPEKLDQHQIQVASVRAGNVIGGGDWAENRIVVDVQAALAEGRSIVLRSPDAVRPWQHVLEPLSGYCQLAATMLANPDPKWCSGWNFGPETRDEMTVAEIVDTFINIWGSGHWEHDVENNVLPEAHVLRLSIEKAIAQLKWSPMWSVEEAIQRTAHWFREYHQDPGQSMLEACRRDIHAYESAWTSEPEIRTLRILDAATSSAETTLEPPMPSRQAG
ncbi:CDP-glucose 4,6-dehydratase [bacterium]|nr:CDP-glucose 4,6-dehydratase [bacterium]